MGAPSADSLYSARLSKTYTTVAADLDLVTIGGSLCRRVRVTGAGDLKIEYNDGSQDTIPSLGVNEHIDVKASRIIASGTTATGVTVFW